MKSLRNQVTVIGNFSGDPQVTTFDSGATVTRFSLGTELLRKPGSESGRVRKLRMFAWGRTAEFINRYCNDGKRIAVSGKLVNRTYPGRSGRLHKVTEVEVRQVVIL